ncbi:alpha-amylase family glycosyl hydrolase [Cesiribacter sp. SM1]|uniref:alpha-amylase family glycosyl hydrolase n=1 Tax=Cesiribacter sp. SM1 TaxID=2861196 RepID=UPI001CD5ED1F|nr:alpha-amylase family glycosyl hydrolase [Cesiribacter sp. SM1]
MIKPIHNFLSLLILIITATAGFAQQIVSIEPAGAGADDEIKIIFNAWAGGGELAGAAKVYMHSGVVTDGPTGTAWTNVKGNWGADDGIGEMTRVEGAQDLWEITLSPTARSYYGVAEGTNIYRLAMVFRNAAGDKKATIAAGDYPWGAVAGNGDFFVNIASGPYVLISQPQTAEIYLQEGESLQIQAEASAAVSSITLYIREEGAFVQKQQLSSGKTITYSYVPTQAGALTIKVVAVINGVEVENSKTIQVYLYPQPVTAALPAGVIKGINYHEDDPSKVTLVLEAPGKDFAYVVGDFTNWLPVSEYLMKQTPGGEMFWLEVTGLNPGEEYVFQYWVEGNTKIGDPYADKVADPWNDQYISASTYPNLPRYNKTDYGVASVLQTAQEAHEWAASEANWTKPEPKDLVVYEVLLRDFLETHNYRDLTDTLSYLKRLGVNAIQLMPVMEFEGNISWGYNPMYHFAPDKYYGTKKELKQFIEAAHQQGMAVILDMVLNHAFGQSPLVKMYWDESNSTVSAASPWFNPQATHPFNVGFDFNHESPYTQSFVDSVNLYWLEEYHFDGFRFDLSKGFTQTNNPDNVGAWSAYDASRIAILKRMADEIWEHTGDAYIILEHFADNQEEKELAEYRAAEGKGMMVWGNLNHAYNQNTMGYAAESDIRWVYHGTRNWSVPHVVGYMESHDEERLMYKNLAYGNAAGNYSVKDEATALNRQKAVGLMFYTIPGPKMIWQFGELGYDISINRCEDGTISDNCRLSPKPAYWEYLDSPEHKSLFDHTADLLRLRNEYSVFTNGTASFQDEGLIKKLSLKNAANTNAPASADEMNVFIVTNFDVTSRNVTAVFPHAGTWYDYYAGGKAVEAGTAGLPLQIDAGMYKMYTDYPIGSGAVTGLPNGLAIGLRLYPNPATELITLETGGKQLQQFSISNMQGISISPRKASGNQWNISSLPTGFYVARVVVAGRSYYLKFVKQ